MLTADSTSRPFRRIRLIFAILAGLVFFTTVLIASAQVRGNYDSLIETEERAARNLARSGESHATQIFKETRRILETVGALYLDRQRFSDFDESVFYRLLKGSIEGADYLYAAYLADKDGYALAAGNMFPMDDQSKSYSFYGIFDIPDDAREFYLGSFTQASPRSGQTIGGRWFIPAILPVTDEANAVQGYVIGLLDPSVFDAFYSTMEVGQHGTVNLWDRRGALVAGNQNSPWARGDVVPEIQGWMTDYASSALADDLRIYAAEADDVALVSTQLGVDDFNFGLAVTLDGRDFLKQWRQVRLQIILEAATFLLVLGALAFVLLRQLKQLEVGEHRIREAKNEAERANIVKVQFLAQVSHEFRTPLNAIIGFSQAIRDRVLGPKLDHKYTEYADDIYNSGRHLLELVTDIIDFSRIEAGEYKVNPTRVDVKASVDDVLAMMSVQALNRQIKLSKRYADEDVYIEADQRLLKQVVINLVANSIKFSEVGSEVTVVIVPAESGGAEVTVSDHGRGMSESILSRIGEPFLVESSETNTEGQGSGLGLSIAKMCMDLMGGRLSVRSKVGVGTDASIVLSERAYQSS